jgi:hypothetical protein
MLRIGDPTYGVGIAPKTLSFDVAVANRLTIGGTLLMQHGLNGSIAGGSVRVGYVIPLGDRLALWPRLGATHESTLDEGSWPLNSRTDVTADARLVWMVSNSWALTIGPSLAVAVQSKRYEPLTSITSPENTPLRAGVAIGITGRIADGSEGQSDAGDAAEPRFFLSVARALPLARYRVDMAIAGKDREGREFEGPPARGDIGTVDATSIVPQSPQLAFDMCVGERLTVGAGGSFGYVRITERATDIVPTSGEPSTLAWTISPRVGLRSPVARTFALWPRLGLTYANASTKGNFLTYQFGADLDAFAVFSPVRGVGLLFGPSFEFPITGVRTVLTRRQDQAVMTLAMTAGLVVALP